MNPKKETVIGIVGGMGPQAGTALVDHISSLTGAAIDQDHLSVILMSFPGHIADRSFFLGGGGCANPAFAIAKVIRKLEAAGAGLIGIACNTAYAPRIYDVILQELKNAGSKVKIIDMPRETCNYISDNYAHVRRVGVMATDGSYRAGIYDILLRQAGFEVIRPDPDFQHEVIHRMIYDQRFGLKAHPHPIRKEVQALAEEALSFFSERKTEAIILGCTELSLLFGEKPAKDMQIVDSTRSLARALIAEITSGVLNPIYNNHL